MQTLHPEHFDQGTIIAQTPFPGFKHNCINVPELRDLTAAEGARLLVGCIKDGLFVPPLESCDKLPAGVNKRALRPAPKITPHDRQVQWNQWTAAEVIRRHRVIGPLWNNIVSNDGTKAVIKRVIWSTGFVELPDPPDSDIESGEPYIRGHDGKSAYITTADQRCLRADYCTIDGDRCKDPKGSAKHAGVFSGELLQHLEDDGCLDNKRQLFIGPLV